MSFKMDPGVHGASGGCHLRRQQDQLGHLAETLGSSEKDDTS